MSPRWFYQGLFIADFSHGCFNAAEYHNALSVDHLHVSLTAEFLRASGEHKKTETLNVRGEKSTFFLVRVQRKKKKSGKNGFLPHAS